MSLEMLGPLAVSSAHMPLLCLEHYIQFWSRVEIPQSHNLLSIGFLEFLILLNCICVTVKCYQIYFGSSCPPIGFLKSQSRYVWLCHAENLQLVTVLIQLAICIPNIYSVPKQSSMGWMGKIKEKSILFQTECRFTAGLLKEKLI